MKTDRRRIAGAVVAAVGVAFIVTVIVNSLFTVGPAFERMTDGFRPAMQPTPITHLQADLKAMAAMHQEFGARAVPMLSRAMGMTPAQFTAFMGGNYPAVATGMRQLPGIVTQFNGVVGTLQAEEARFARADAIPTSNIPATAFPWAMLVAGIVALGLGIFLIVRPGRAGFGVAAGIGALLVVPAFSLSWPQKAQAADTLNAHLKPVYTATMLTQAKGALNVMGAMGQQMHTEMLPALGTQLHMDQAQVQAFFGKNLPTTAAAMRSMPAAMGRFQGLVQRFQSSLADYQTINSVSFVPIVWTVIGGGLVLLSAGAGGLLFRRKASVEEEEVSSVERKAA